MGNVYLKADEISGILEMVNLIINKRIVLDTLSYTELINIKNKLYK